VRWGSHGTVGGVPREGGKTAVSLRKPETAPGSTEKNAPPSRPRGARGCGGVGGKRRGNTKPKKRGPGDEGETSNPKTRVGEEKTLSENAAIRTTQ